MPCMYMLPAAPYLHEMFDCGGSCEQVNIAYNLSVDYSLPTHALYMRWYAAQGVQRTCATGPASCRY